jgi:hypothetical protein
MRVITEKTLVMPKRATPDISEICFHMDCDPTSGDILCAQCVFGNLKNYEAARKVVNSDAACIKQKEGLDIRRTK